MGGLARRAGKIDTYRRPDHGLIVLDAGDSLAPRHAAFGAPAEELRPTAGTILQAMGMMGTDGLLPGEADLAAGLRWLTKEAGHAGLPLLAANLKARVRGKSPFVRRKLVTTGGVKVGLFGVLDLEGEPQEMVDLFKKTKVKQTPALKAARAQVKALSKAGAEVVVMLAHMNQQKVRDLLEKVEGIHVAILGHHGMRLGQPMKVGNTFLVEAGRRGQAMGHVQIELGPSWDSGAPLKDDSARHTAYQGIVQQIAVLKQLLSTVDPDQEPPPPAVELDRRLKEQIKAYREMGAAAGDTRLAASLINLDDTVPEHPAVTALVKGKKAATGDPAAAAQPTRAVVGTPIQIPGEVIRELDREAALKGR